MASFFNRALRMAAFLLVVPVAESFFFLHKLDFLPPAMTAWVVWVLVAERKNILVIAAHRARFIAHVFLVLLAIVFPTLGLLAVASGFFLWVSPRTLWATPMRMYSALLLLAVAVRPLTTTALSGLSAPFALSTSSIAFQLSGPFISSARALSIDASNSGLDSMILIGLLIPFILALGPKKSSAAASSAYLGWAVLYIFIINAVRVAVLGTSMQFLVPTLGIYGFFAGTRSLWAPLNGPAHLWTESPA